MIESRRDAYSGFLNQFPKGCNESPEDCRLDSRVIENAFRQLDERAEIQRRKIADLEVDFVNSLKYSDRGMPCLEDRINQNPEFFAEIVAMAYGLAGFKEDRKDDVSFPEDVLRENAEKAYVLLGSLKRLPGRNESGEIESENLVEWIRKTRSAYESSERFGIDYRIGVLLSNCPEGKDGIWPYEPVRNALEKVYSEEISEGFKTGRRNARGAYIGFGGDPERELERGYRESAEKIKYSHPKSSKMLRELADFYSAMANYQDTEAEKFYRQLSF